MPAWESLEISNKPTLSASRYFLLATRSNSSLHYVLAAMLSYLREFAMSGACRRTQLVEVDRYRLAATRHYQTSQTRNPYSTQNAMPRVRHRAAKLRVGTHWVPCKHRLSVRVETQTVGDRSPNWQVHLRSGTHQEHR